jgi:hypothetical protein
MVEARETETRKEKEVYKEQTVSLSVAASIEDELRKEDLQRQSLSSVKKLAVPTFRPAIVASTTFGSPKAPDEADKGEGKF